MKKAEWYSENYANTVYSIADVIKMAQEEAIRETVKECAENAETIISDDFLLELGKFGKIKAPSNKDYIYKPSILSVADKLIKEL